jgi:hypothetical protein
MYDVLEEYLRGQSVSVVDDRFVIRTIPTVNWNSKKEVIVLVILVLADVTYWAQYPRCG